MTPFFALLLVPAPAMGAFLLLGLGPAEFNRRAVQTIALAGAMLPAVVMLPLGAYCLMGTCDGIQPIFDLEVGPAVVALGLALYLRLGRMADVTDSDTVNLLRR